MFKDPHPLLAAALIEDKKQANKQLQKDFKSVRNYRKSNSSR